MNKFKLRLLPTILFSALVILIVRAKAYSLGVGDMPNVPFDSSSELWDTFNYAKSSAIFAIAVYAALTLTYLLIVGRIRIKKTIIYIPMLVYTAGVIISYVMSDYKWMAMRGSIHRFEGTRTIICYMFMLFYTINVVDELKDALIIVSSVLVSAFFCCIIGVTQFLGFDILLSDFAKFFIAGTKDLQLSATFSRGQVYQTVANMNYVGMYLSLIVPIVVYAVYYFSSNKNKLTLSEHGIYNNNCNKIIGILGLFLVIIALNVAGAGSLGGLLGIAVALVVLLLEFIEKRKLKSVLIGVFSVVFILALLYMYGRETDDHSRTGHRQIEYIETGSNLVSMSIDGNEINIIYDKDSDGYSLEDGDGNPVRIFWFAEEPGIYQVDDPRYGGKIRIIPYKNDDGQASAVVEVMDNDLESFYFGFYEDGVKFINPYGRKVSLKKVESIGFENHLSAGNGRGYIWSRTLPLLKSRILIGAGADTFLYLFPQDDYAGKYSSGTALDVTYDKPHNLYLNIAVSTGILSLVAFLTMVGMILWKAFHQGEDKKYIKVIAAGIIGFLVAGIFNDSTVAIMPMFYGLLGTLMGICLETENGI